MPPYVIKTTPLIQEKLFTAQNLFIILSIVCRNDVSLGTRKENMNPYLFDLLSYVLLFGFPLWLVYRIVKDMFDYCKQFSLADDEEIIGMSRQESHDTLITVLSPVETQDRLRRAKPD